MSFGTAHETIQSLLTINVGLAFAYFLFWQGIAIRAVFDERANQGRFRLFMMAGSSDYPFFFGDKYKRQRRHWFLALVLLLVSSAVLVGFSNWTGGAAK